MTLMPFSSWNVNKLRRYCLLDTSLLRHIMTFFSETSENKNLDGGGGYIDFLQQ